MLASQITNECIWDTDKSNLTLWGGRNDTDVSNCISLISRVNNVMSTSEYNKIFGFRRQSIQDAKNLKIGINEFLESDKRVLRLDFPK